MPQATGVATEPTDSVPAGDARPIWPRVLAAAPAYIPAVIIAIGGWAYRWIDEDAYINLRIVDQIFAGHGPVFNAGERVEAATSPLWLVVILVARALFGAFASAPWIAELASLFAAIAAFVVGGYAVRVLHRNDEGVAVPVGLLLVSSVAVAWEFATSGLDIGLAWLWIASAWLVIVWVARSESVSGAKRSAGAVVLGLATLVRPEFGLMMVCLVVAWFMLVRPRRVALDLVAIFALPVAAEIFRMGYYASLVPTTALAKDSGGSHFGQGWHYAADFVNPYRLWVSFALIAAIIVLRHVRRPDRRVAIATAAMLAAGLLDGFYIVASGGDYMHGRLLLPAFFAIALPASISVPRAARSGIAVAAAAGVWALVTLVAFRPPYPPPNLGFMPAPVADWRTVALHRVKGPGIDIGLAPNGPVAREQQARGVRGYFRATDKLPRPGVDPNRYVITYGSIGESGFAAGTHVWIIDLAGLAEPLAARTAPVPGRPAGHRKDINSAWYDARFSTDTSNPKSNDARRALQCQPLRGLIDAIDGPLTVGQFFSNIWHSFTYTRLRIPDDPAVAAAKWCH